MVQIRKEDYGISVGQNLYRKWGKQGNLIHTIKSSFVKIFCGFVVTEFAESPTPPTHIHLTQWNSSSTLFNRTE